MATNPEQDAAFNAGKAKDVVAADDRGAFLDELKKADHRPHDHDFNAEAIARAKREGWNNGGGGTN